MLSNAAIAERLDAYAVLLELSGAEPYTSRAYRRAAETIRGMPLPVADLVRQGRARELRGIGPGIERRLRELIETGEIHELSELEREVRPELIGLGRYLGVSPRQVVEIGRTLGVADVDELREAARSGRLTEVPGIGPKRAAQLLEALERGAPPPGRGLTLGQALALEKGLAEALGGGPAGDPRRMRDLSEHFAVVCAAEEPADVFERFEALAQVVSILERGERRTVGVTVEGVAVEVVVAEPARFGTELVRATGSRAYVDALEPLPDAPDEAGVYRALGVPWCPAELREAPFRGEPPPLVELGDVRGDLHCHTTWSDGRESVLEMATAARDRGYDYLAICDHTKAVGAVPGLDSQDVLRQADEIAEANELLAPFRTLRGIECDILPDGSLDLEDPVLADLDWVTASIHAGQRAPRREITARTVAALRHPAVRALSHPTGRMIGRRPPNAVDIEEVIAVALEERVALEVNGLPDRLDLRDDHVRMCVEAGLPILCNTDAHSVRGLGNMRLSVGTARRGWATAADVLNTRPLDELLAWKRGAPRGK
jgi:DNA polymerase (family 10)